MIQIGSFNIRTGRANDGDNSWPLRRDLCVSFIRELTSDAGISVLGLQEAEHFQLEYLAAQLAEFDWVGVGREDGVNQGEYAPIFFDRSKWTLREHGTFWLSENPHVPGSMSWQTACTRICTWAALSGPSSEILIANTHWDHVSSLAQLNSATVIQSQLPLDRYPNAVLCGDFNCEPDSDPVAELESLGWNLADTADVGTFHDFKGGFDGENIDHIFSTGTCGVRHIADSVIDGKAASDHHFVWAEVKF